ncbi:methylated-DNA--[protein]-cysteine S-methyltransferase [Lacticaseibacillus jixiensis]|uniref:methylated-DNA--[protein]-cysteine S-methyltransferase n=1 Tax=Lacticaseibacillus jixiensis TaxID=3231926 RepID=UPI0036F3C973
MLQQTTYASPLGNLTLLGSATALYGVWFEDQAYYGGQFDLTATPVGDNASLQATRQWLDAYFAGRQLPRPNLHYSGTPFRQLVQQALVAIPYGKTVTYRDLAEQLAKAGHHTSPRAIGGAVGHNPLSLVVPCHRVVGVDGSLTGYAGGIKRKQALLQLEGAI